MNKSVNKKIMNTKTTTTTLALALATTVAAFGGTKTQTPAEKLETKALYSGVYGVEVSSGFVNKGRRLDSNAVFQPFAAISIPTKLEIGGGVEINVVLASRQQLNTKSPLSVWSRSENNLGLSFTKDRLSLISTYEIVTSPNNSYKSSQGVNLVLEFDDMGLTTLPIKPHVRTYIGTKEGFERQSNYFEAGISPTVTAGITNITFPINIGVGDKGFYVGGERYGYTSAGIATLTPIYKDLSLTTNLTYFNTNENINNGKKDLWLTSAGFVVKF